MAALTIRKIDDDVKDALKKLADQDGRSVEGYVRHILYEVVRLNAADNSKRNLAQDIREIMLKNKAFIEDEEFSQRQELVREVDI